MSLPLSYSKFKAFDPATGLPLEGGKLYSYAAGTSTPTATYLDAALQTENDNPILLDAYGEAVVYLNVSTKLVLKTSAGATIWTMDNLSASTLTDEVWVTDPRFGADATGVTDSTVAIQAAIDFLSGGGIINFPPGIFKVNVASLVLKEGQILQGAGTKATTIINSTNNWLFQYITDFGTTKRIAPKIRGLFLNANYGVKLNDPDNGFTVDDSSQEYMGSPLIEDCLIQSYNNGTGIGVQWTKTFNGVINRTEIKGYDKGVVFHGSDSCEITGSSRIWDCTTYLIGLNPDVTLYNYNGFGSQAHLKHIELLSLKNGGTAFIVTADMELICENCFIEPVSGTPTYQSVVKVLPGYYFGSGRGLGGFAVRNNRITVDASMTSVGSFDFTGFTGANILPVIMDLRGNWTTGAQPGSVALPSGGIPYYFNAQNRRHILVDGSPANIIDSMPFNSRASVEYQGRTAFVFSPNLPGLSNSDYGVSVKVDDGYFILPPVASYGSIITGTSGANGAFDISVEAQGGAAGQILSWQILDGSTPLVTGTQALTTSMAWYTLTTNQASTNLVIKFWNDDLVNNSNVNLKRAVAEYHV